MFVCEQNDISTDACLSLSSLKKILGGIKSKESAWMGIYEYLSYQIMYQ